MHAGTGRRGDAYGGGTREGNNITTIRTEPTRRTRPAVFKRLEVFRVNCYEVVDADLLVDALAHCTRIKMMRLGHHLMSNEQVELVLSRMHQQRGAILLGFEWINCVDVG